jgi:hypothetical protein
LLLARKDHADGAAIAVSAAEASLASSIASVEAMDARVIRCRDRYAELSAAVAAQGLAELRQRAEELEKDLELTRRDRACGRALGGAESFWKTGNSPALDQARGVGDRAERQRGAP